MYRDAIRHVAAMMIITIVIIVIIVIVIIVIIVIVTTTTSSISISITYIINMLLLCLRTRRSALCEQSSSCLQAALPTPPQSCCTSPVLAGRHAKAPAQHRAVREPFPPASTHLRPDAR